MNSFTEPHSRRRWAVRTVVSALATAGGAATRIQAVDGTAAPVRWKVAIGLNGFESGERKFGKRYPLWEILAFAADGGFDGIELVSSWPQGGYPSSDDKRAVDALKRLHVAYGQRIFSIQLGADGAFDPDAEVRRRWVAGFAEKALLASALGCAHVGLWPGGGLRGQTLEQALERLVGSFREADRIARDIGVVAGFEIEPPFVFNTEDHQRRILEGSGMRFIYDPSHCDLFTGSKGHPHEMLSRLGVDKVAYVHLTDTDGTLRDGGTSKHVPVGTGHADIARSLAVLRDGGYRGWIMADTWEMPDPYEGCRAVRDAVRASGR
jgi:sugar phosphate isomerase/epimerase